MSGALILCPISISDALEFVRRHHRHHGLPPPPMLAVAVARAEGIVGVATIGRPVARALCDGWTAEVTRVAVIEGVPHACSMLYGAAWRACRALGYRRLQTYTLQSEPGTSLRAAGWRCIGEAGGGSWTCPSRPRIDRHPLQMKLRWEVSA